MTPLEKQVWIHDGSDSEEDGELITATTKGQMLPLKKRPRTPLSDSELSSCRTPSPPLPVIAPHNNTYKRSRLSKNCFEAKIRDFVNTHGHLPRCRIKNGSAPFLANERVIGFALAQMRSGDGWTLPPWWPSGPNDDRWDSFVDFLDNAPTKQQLDSQQAVLKNIYDWCDAAVLIGCVPSTAIPRDLDANDTEKLAAWARASRAQRLVSNIFGGQFYHSLMAPAMDYATSTLGTSQPNLVEFLRERLQRSLLLRADRVARRRTSRVARNEKIREIKLEKSQAESIAPGYS